MKKKLLLLTLVLAMLVMLLSSCSFLEQLGINLDFLTPSPVEADRLLKEADEKMEQLASYETRGILDLTFFYEGVEFAVQTTTTNVFINDTTQNYYYYDKTITNVKAPALWLDETSVSLDAYHDGHYFLLRKTGNEPYQKITTAMTREEAIAFQDNRIAEKTGNLDFSDCTKKTVTQNEDGSYTLAFSEYEDAVVEAYWEAFGFYEDMIEAEIRDLNITVVINANHLLDQIRTSFVFEEAETAGQTPSFTYTVNTLACNAATRKTDELILADYTEEPNLRAIYDLGSLWNKRAEASEGSFLLTLEEAIYIDGNKNGSKSETDDVIFGVNTFGYYFTISYVEQDGTRTKLDYSSGIVEITRNGEVQYASQTEKEAKDFVKGLIRSYDYNPDAVKSIEVKSDGVYKLTVKSSFEGHMQSLLQSMGAEYQSTEQTFIFTVTNGSLVRVQGTVVGTGTENGSVITYVASSDIFFR